ncbi:MAG: lysine--tRNA ligase [Tepidisphaerales bacterium]
MAASPSPAPSGPSEYELARRHHRDQIAALGFDPYGRAVDGLTPLAAAKARYTPDMGHDGGPYLTVAGRIVLKRDLGKLSFYTLRDDTGDLQVGFQKNVLSDREWSLLKLLDTADHIVVRGRLGVTNKGEVTVWASPPPDAPSNADAGAASARVAPLPAVEIAAKALLPPPEKYHGLADVELRYRQRYVDLFANPDVLRTMQTRIRIVEEVRAYFRSRGYLEVETPMLQPLHGGASARPFITHHNALDMKLYLRIAPELYLKRLLVGGFSKVFELNRNFRNEGISPRHNPEFTMLEAYEAYGSWQTMASLVEDLICTVARNVLGTLRIEHRNASGEVSRTIDLTPPWPRVRMTELVAQRTGWAFDGRPLQDAAPEVLDRLRAEGARIDAIRQHTPHEQLVEVYEKLIEPTLINPTFVTHVPSVIIPLAREERTPDGKPTGFAEVYELAVNGVEISPGYSELNDPDVQEAHFRHQVGDEAERQQIDHDFLNALKHGMPPAGGMGLGIDRLVMMLTGAESIRDVILFPLMRPQA